MSMKTIGVLFGKEQTFPPALIDYINNMPIDNIQAEAIKVGGVKIAQRMKYDVILDRISHNIPFYRSILQNSMLTGTRVTNNPFWSIADDKFFSYSLALKMGIPVPKTVILPSKEHPADTSSESMRNLIYPLNWEEIFSYVGFPAYMKPDVSCGWKDVYRIQDAQEFFHNYNKTGSITMLLQEEIEFEEYYRCYVIGKKYVHIMPYQPRNPHHLRYDADFTPSRKLEKCIKKYCLDIMNSLGYDCNSIEFAVRDGVPYAIDYLNCAPDAELNSVTQRNFDWFVEHMAKFLVEQAQQGRAIPKEYSWSRFMQVE